MGAERGPGGFGGQTWDLRIDGVEVGDSLGADDLFGGDAQTVRVALNRVEQSGGWVVEFDDHTSGR